MPGHIEVPCLGEAQLNDEPISQESGPSASSHPRPGKLCIHLRSSPAGIQAGPQADQRSAWAPRCDISPDTQATQCLALVRCSEAHGIVR